VEIVQPLAEGTGVPIVVLDFRGGRPEADFVDLLGGGATTRPIYELVALGLTEEEVPATAAAYARAYADALEPYAAGGLDVLGYCSGGLLAHALAVELARRGAAIGTLVLFDAVPIGTDGVVDAYQDVARTPGGGPDGVEERIERALDAGDPEAAYAAVLDGLGSAFGAQLEAVGVPPDSPLARELLARHRAWLAYVVAAASYRAEPFPGRLVAVFSSGVDADPLPAQQTAVRRVGVPRDRLLGDADVRAATLTAMER
jgi:thioesterase domain-containing protein